MNIDKRLKTLEKQLGVQGQWEGQTWLFLRAEEDFLGRKQEEGRKKEKEKNDNNPQFDALFSSSTGGLKGRNAFLSCFGSATG